MKGGRLGSALVLERARAVTYRVTYMFLGPQ